MIKKIKLYVQQLSGTKRSTAALAVYPDAQESDSNAENFVAKSIRLLLPYLLLTPQLMITLIFFILPALTALKLSLFKSDAFGISSHFVGLANFVELCHDASYINSLWVTCIFSFSVTILSLVSALLMALIVSGVTRGQLLYKTLLIWPYAVAPAVAGMLMRFLFNPAIGVMTNLFNHLGYQWNYMLHPGQAMFLVIFAAAWQQFSYNFIFFLAGIQTIPESFLEAAAIDGAGPIRRFFTIIFPLLSPTTFFLLSINLIYAFFNTFGIIQVITQGGPANMTDILVYKVYNDGFVGLDIGSSSAQSVLLMLIVIALTFLQFYFLERKVHYK
jgi:sn-glycerol 3-phosphate transport system permease protein